MRSQSASADIGERKKGARQAGSPALFEFSWKDPSGTLEGENDLRQFLKVACPHWLCPRPGGGNDINRVVDKLRAIGVFDTTQLVKRVTSGKINDELVEAGFSRFSKDTLDSIRKQSPFLRAMEALTEANFRQTGAFAPCAQLLSQRNLRQQELKRIKNAWTPLSRRGTIGPSEEGGSPGRKSVVTPLTTLGDSSILQAMTSPADPATPDPPMSSPAMPRASLRGGRTRSLANAAMVSAYVSLPALAGSPLSSVPTSPSQGLGRGSVAVGATAPGRAQMDCPPRGIRHAATWTSPRAQAQPGEGDTGRQTLSGTRSPGRQTISGTTPDSTRRATPGRLTQAACADPLGQPGDGLEVASPGARSTITVNTNIKWDQLERLATEGTRMATGQMQPAWTVLKKQESSVMEQAEAMLVEQREKDERTKLYRLMRAEGQVSPMRKHITNNIRSHLKEVSGMDAKDAMDVQHRCTNIRKQLARMVNARRELNVQIKRYN